MGRRLLDRMTGFVAKRSRALCLGFGIALLAATPAMAKDYNVTITGSAFCRDSTTGQDMPLVGARVQMMDSDARGSTIFDDIMGASHVNPDGSFMVTGKGGDPGNYSWSRPDVYVRIVFNDDVGARETDEINNDQWFDTPEHKHDNTPDGSQIDFGGWVNGVHAPHGDGTKCGVWMNAHRAYQDAVTLLGGPPPAGHYHVLYWSAVWSGTPWTNTDTTHWPIGFPLYASYHEFGHSVRHAADGNGSHFTYDVVRFRYARNHSTCDAGANANALDSAASTRAFAFNEGWAEYWSGDVSGCGSITRPDLEGNVAAALFAIGQTPGMSKKRMVAVLTAHPGAIHSLDDFIKFQPQPLGLTISQLIQNHLSAAEVHPPVSFTPEDQAAQATRVRIELARLTAPLADAIAPIAPAIANLGGPCGRVDCEQAFQAAIGPAVRRADADLKALAVRRLRASLDGGQAAAMRQVAAGTLERTLIALEAGERAQTVTIVSRAYEQAISAASPLAAKSPEVALLVQDLRDKAVRFRAAAAGGGPLPNGVTERVTLPEDDATAR